MVDINENLIEEQSILPGFRREVGYPKKDWRAWTDGRGQKVDAPKWKGRTSYAGKLIPIPLDKHGNPFKLGTFQVLYRADGMYIVCDWSIKELGDQTIFATNAGPKGGLIRALQVMTKWHKWKHWVGPVRRGWTREMEMRMKAKS